MAAEDLFAQFFGGGGGGGGPFGGMFGGGGGGGRPQGPQKVKTILHMHKVTLEDVYKGKTAKLALQKQVICSKCAGTGAKEPHLTKKCSGCGGAGVKTMMRQMGPMIQRFQAACTDCAGTGEIIKEKDKCKVCHGKKTSVERKVLHLHIDRGARPGTRIEFRGEGDQVPGAEAGDVVFEIEQKPHPRFERKDDDLYYHADIDILTALAGGKINIEHLDDRWVSIDIIPGEVISPGKKWILGRGMFNANHKSGTVKVVRGQGMPSPRHHDFGNLYIQFNVKFPTSLGTEDHPFTPEHAKLLEQVLPPRVEPTPIPIDANIDEVVLEELDPTRERTQMKGATGEDDDEEMGGGERVQCATQ